MKELFAHCETDEAGLKKRFNQEFEIKFRGCALKFHNLSLESVIALESNKTVFSALMDSEVLEVLSAFQPVVVGTFPLALNVVGSDLDVLLYAENLRQLEHEIRGAFSGYSKFHIELKEIEGVASLICRYSVQGVPFELFGQTVPTVKQRAYQHFNIEERLLKIGGNILRGRIMKLRQGGMKTEPAFANTLNLDGDSYQALQYLFRKSNLELTECVERSFKET